MAAPSKEILFDGDGFAITMAWPSVTHWAMAAPSPVSSMLQCNHSAMVNCIPPRHRPMVILSMIIVFIILTSKFII